MSAPPDDHDVANATPDGPELVGYVQNLYEQGNICEIWVPETDKTGKMYYLDLRLVPELKGHLVGRMNFMTEQEEGQESASPTHVRFRAQNVFGRAVVPATLHIITEGKRIPSPPSEPKP